MQNVPECMQNVPEYMQNVPESMPNVPECMQNVPECSKMHADLWACMQLHKLACSNLSLQCSRMYAECSRMYAECSRMYAECSRMHAEYSRMFQNACRSMSLYQGGTKLFAVSDRKLSMIPDSRVLESNKSKKLAAIEILRTFWQENTGRETFVKGRHSCRDTLWFRDP